MKPDLSFAARVAIVAGILLALGSSLLPQRPRHQPDSAESTTSTSPVQRAATAPETPVASRATPANQPALHPPSGLDPASHHTRLDAKGELFDAWGNPFFFHLLGRDQLEVRSAGPDGALYTDDDLVACHRPSVLDD